MGIGLREVVGLALFALAALAALTFLDPTAYSSTRAPEISQGLPAPTGEPATVVPTPTPVTESFPMPGDWFVNFYQFDEAGAEGFFSRSALGEVNFAFQGGPVGSLADDAWSVLAEAPVSLPAGRYAVRVVYDCEVEVLLNGAAIATADDGEGENQLNVVFDHPGGSLVLGVRGTDVGGPFVLRVEGGQ